METRKMMLGLQQVAFSASYVEIPGRSEVVFLLRVCHDVGLYEYACLLDGPRSSKDQPIPFDAPGDAPAPVFDMQLVVVGKNWRGGAETETEISFPNFPTNPSLHNISTASSQPRQE